MALVRDSQIEILLVLTPQGLHLHKLNIVGLHRNQTSFQLGNYISRDPQASK